MPNINIIAIKGPAGSGKSKLARKIAMAAGGTVSSYPTEVEYYELKSPVLWIDQVHGYVSSEYLDSIISNMNESALLLLVGQSFTLPEGLEYSLIDLGNSAQDITDKATMRVRERPIENIRPWNPDISQQIDGIGKGVDTIIASIAEFYD